MSTSLTTDGKFKNPLSAYQRFIQLFLLNVRPAPVASLLKRMLLIRRTAIKSDAGNFWIDPVSNLGRALSRDGIYEPRMQQTLARYLHPGATFVDLGANEGYFSVLAAKLVGAAGRVVAIEPQERLLHIINENFRLNDIDGVTVLNVALADATGPVTIHLAADTNTGASGPHRMAKYRLPTQKAEGLTLAQVLDEQKLSFVDFMKVDIEGAEYEVLLGSPEVFRQGRIGALGLELHPTILEARGKNAADIVGMLSSNGYRMASGDGSVVWERSV